MKPLPLSVQEIAEVIGRDDALYLVGQLPRYKTPSRGGTEIAINVPRIDRLKPDHRLSQILGYPLAKKLSVHFGGQLLKAANCNGLVKGFRNREIIRLWESGSTILEIAEIFNMTPKYTKKILSDLGYNIEHKILQVASNDT